MSHQDPTSAESLRGEILRLVAQYTEVAHGPRPFVAGKTPVPVSGKVFGASELQLLVESSLEFWLTTGRFNTEFERRLAGAFGLRKALTVNSGSSANLLAVSALTSHMHGERALQPGDEVITVAAGFPTTVNPLFLYGLTPVFVDIHIPTYNADVSLIADAITPKTKAIVLAHTLGNPFDAAAVEKLATDHKLWLIEDCCDALGATFQGRHVGNFGDIATVSFYPAHHITMGEGGAVLTNSPAQAKVLESIRDWGRDCWCAPGVDNTCGKRFLWQLGKLPLGYDHKYTYSHLGFNLKITDMQAAVALAQIDRLPGFVERRRHNFAGLAERLANLQDVFILPEATPGSNPSWFGFPITIRPDAPFNRQALLTHLDAHKIATRLIFGGNLCRQPYFAGRQYRVHGELTRSDEITERAFWLGVFPAITDPMLDYVAEVLSDFVATSRSS
jgi:CDP-6-deoxy-D-xylo-4-hexulose-3-dehydrase